MQQRRARHRVSRTGRTLTATLAAMTLAGLPAACSDDDGSDDDSAASTITAPTTTASAPELSAEQQAEFDGNVEFAPPPHPPPPSACILEDTFAAGYSTVMTINDLSVNETSGLAHSKLWAETFYTHNEDTNNVFAVKLGSGVVGDYSLQGVTPRDFEDIATGPCPSGQCVYIGDIGFSSDNFPSGTRTSGVIYRVAEPNMSEGQTSGALPVEAFHYTFPDGNWDSETLMVHPTTGNIYIVTKAYAIPGQSRVYRYPTPLENGRSRVLTYLTTIQLPTTADPNYSEATAGDIHPCAERFLLRTYRTVYEFRAPSGQDFESAFFAAPVQLTDTAEGQGEAIAYKPDGAGYYTLTEATANQPIKFVAGN